MPTYIIGPEKFREECSRRLIDTWELQLLLGLRSKPSVWNRVKAGTLPQPVLVKKDTVALWDRDELAGFPGVPETT